MSHDQQSQAVQGPQKFKILGVIPASPLDFRRWQLFKQNRRAWWSLWILIAIAALSLPAEFWANDKPILIWSDQGVFFPIFVDYLETDFGGFLPFGVEYYTPEVDELLAGINATVINPPIPYAEATELNAKLQPPSSLHFLGVDAKSRDLLTQVIYGVRISLMFGLILTVVTTITGVTAGALSGYYGGWTDLIFQRFVDIYSSIPLLYVLIILASIFTPGFWTLLLLFILFSWHSGLAIVRIEFLKARKLDYVRAARALGMPERTIIFKHILPNALVATLAILPFSLAGSVTALSSLDYLGFGLQDASASLGEITLQAQNNQEAWWLTLTAFMSLGGLLTLMIFIGEGIRDAFDPRKALR